jgi:hypothetical protein
MLFLQQNSPFIYLLVMILSHNLFYASVGKHHFFLLLSVWIQAADTLSANRMIESLLFSGSLGSLQICLLFLQKFHILSVKLLVLRWLQKPLVKDRADHVLQNHILCTEPLLFNSSQELIITDFVIPKTLIKVLVTKLQGLTQMLNISNALRISLIDLLDQFIQ